MTVDELKTWIQSEMQEVKDITSDSENSSRYQHLIGEYRALRRVLSKLEKLQPAPVYHKEDSILANLQKYLDETPREHVLAEWEAANNLKGGITVDDYLKSVCTGNHVEYHYLPEVPQNNEWVLGYFENWVGGEECQYHGGEWYDHVGMPMKNTPYAWTRIPPKPPVKEGGSDGNA